jgi:hypothetical protein
MAETSLLDLILNLLSDDEEAEQFADDPDGYLKAHGLEGICADDVRDAAPLVLDYAPVTLKSSFDRTYDTGNHGSAYGGEVSQGGDGGGKHHRDDDHKGDNDDDKDDVVKEINNILNSYSYTSVDDRDTLFDQSVNQTIYNKGFLAQSFDYDTVVASGDGAVAAGENVYGAATGDGAVAVGGDNYGDVVTGDGNVTGHGNAFVKGDDNVVGDENEVGNTDVDVNVEDSFQDNDGVDDSFNGNDLSDHSDDDGYDIDESFDDNDLSTDNSVNDSLNDNEIGNTETEVEVEDVAVAVDHAIAAVDNKLDVDA